jgi:hypothetical protein
MVMIRLTGRINEAGKLEVELPQGLSSESVIVTIESLVKEEALLTPFWTEEELTILNAPRSPRTGAEIAERIRVEGGGWEDLDITDSQAYIQELRRQRQDDLTW